MQFIKYTFLIHEGVGCKEKETVKNAKKAKKENRREGAGERGWYRKWKQTLATCAGAVGGQEKMGKMVKWKNKIKLGLISY